jgi:hypothetical protein
MPSVPPIIAKRRSDFGPTPSPIEPNFRRFITNECEKDTPIERRGKSMQLAYNIEFNRENWRRGPGSNRRIKVLQTSPLPLGYRALGRRPHGLQVVPLPPVPGSKPPTKCGMERETRLELATLALARRCSTTELLPLNAVSSIPGRGKRVKPTCSVRNCFLPWVSGHTAARNPRPGTWKLRL